MSITLAAMMLMSSDVPSEAAGIQSVQDAPRLTDAALDAIRGGQGVALGVGGSILTATAQDATIRDFTIVRSTTVQQFDNWMNDTGYLMIAANIYREL